MNRTAITIQVAAYSMLENAYTADEVVTILNALTQPAEGYVYADDVPDFTKITTHSIK
jgi:hypothetical protein